MTSREQFEQAIKARFGDSIDYRVCKNSDGEYMAWDMQVAWWSWQAASKASEQQLAAVIAENAGLKGIVSEINNELYGQGFQVSGWHLNGALEPLDSWFTDNGWGEPETPATGAYLAEVRALARNEGINYAASRLAAAYNHGFVDKPLAEVYDVVRMILTAKEDLANEQTPAADGLSGEYAEKSLVEFAAQLRQEAQ